MYFHLPVRFSRWMRGEAHDHEYPDEIPIANECSNLSAFILVIAFIWLLIYYTIFLPFNLIYSSKASLLEYDDGQLRPRCSAFRHFRQYENLHMLVWIAKDLAWNRLNLPIWLIFFVATIYISADLMVTAVTSNSTVSSACDIAEVRTVQILRISGLLMLYRNIP